MGEQQDYHWLDKHARVRINTVRLSTTPRHGSELWAHMRNFHFVAHDGNMDKKPPPPVHKYQLLFWPNVANGSAC